MLAAKAKAAPVVSSAVARVLEEIRLTDAASEHTTARTLALKHILENAQERLQRAHMALRQAENGLDPNNCNIPNNNNCNSNNNNNKNNKNNHTTTDPTKALEFQLRDQTRRALLKLINDQLHSSSFRKRSKEGRLIALRRRAQASDDDRLRVRVVMFKRAVSELYNQSQSTKHVQQARTALNSAATAVPLAQRNPHDGGGMTGGVEMSSSNKSNDGLLVYSTALSLSATARDVVEEACSFWGLPADVTLLFWKNKVVPLDVQVLRLHAEEANSSSGVVIDAPLSELVFELHLAQDAVKIIRSRPSHNKGREQKNNIKLTKKYITNGDDIEQGRRNENMGRGYNDYASTATREEEEEEEEEEEDDQIYTNKKAALTNITIASRVNSSPSNEFHDGMLTLLLFILAFISFPDLGEEHMKHSVVRALRRALLAQEFTSEESGVDTTAFKKRLTYSKMVTKEEIWMYVDRVLGQFLFGVDGSDGSQFAQNVHLVVGHVRFRQLRVRVNAGCVKPPNADSLVNVPENCYAHFTPFAGDARTFGPPGYQPGFKWESHDNLLMEHGTPPFNGVLSTYDSSGFYLDADARNFTSWTDSTALLLQEFEWIDQKTSAVFISMSLFNPSINVYTAVQLLMEQDRSGSFITTAKMMPFRARADNAYASPERIALIFSIAPVIVMVLFKLRRLYRNVTMMHLAAEASGVKLSQRHVKSVDGWLVLDWCVIALFLSYYIMHLINISLITGVVATMWETDIWHFVDIGVAYNLDYATRIVGGVLMGLCVARALRVLRLTRWGFIFTQLVIRAFQDFLIVLVFALLLVIGMAMLLHWTSGPLSIQWSTYSGAFTSTLEVFTGINSQHVLTSLGASANDKEVVVLIHIATMCMSWILYALIVVVFMSRYLNDLHLLNARAYARVHMLEQVWRSVKSLVKETLCVKRICARASN